MATMATGRPPLSSTARRITAGGMSTPIVAIRTSDDCDGCLSHFAFLNGDRNGREVGSFTVPGRPRTGASAGIGGWAHASGLHVDGIHVGRVQDVRLLHIAEVD